MEDFKSAHLAWIHATKTFTPKYAHDYTLSYYDIMAELYNNPKCTQDLAKKFFICDQKWFRECSRINKQVSKMVDEVSPVDNNFWFVTIGFNHQTWSVSKCCKAIEKIISMEWIISCKANFELHRENGEHPHIHFLLETKEPKSRILDKLFRPKYVKDLVLSKSFIDVKPAQEHHRKYIELDKQTDKLEYVQKDREWRIKNGIPDYQKNWS